MEAMNIHQNPSRIFVQPDGCLPVSPVEVRQVLDDLARDDEAHDGGHERSRARDVAPVGAFSGRAGRADAVVPAADGRVLDRADRLFLRIDDLEMRNALLPAELPHDARKRAHRRFKNIRHPERRVSVRQLTATVV